YPDKLKELQDAFDVEARKYNVYPLDASFASRVDPAIRPSVVESVYEANPFEWFLLRTVHHRWRRNPCGLIDRGANVDDMGKLRSDCTLVFDPCRPRDGQTIPGAAEM